MKTRALIVRPLITAMILALPALGSAVPEPGFYALEFVSTAATGIAMNDNGDVVGTSYVDTGCGSTCLPPLETVAWVSGVRKVLPAVPGLSPIAVKDINNSGWITGYAGYDYSNAHAVVWKPSGSTYQTLDLGTLPGTTISTAAGLDDTGRVVGYSTTQFFPPVGAAPFVWADSTGMLDLTTQGAPIESPLAISSGGAVATPGFWYSLDTPTVVNTLAPPPTGFSGPGSYPAAINDAGDQARFQISTGTGFYPYLFRYHREGTWKQIWPMLAGNLSPYGIGSINNDGDITATVTGTGLVAYGPDGSAETLAGKLSPAYGGKSVTVGGPINNAGEILAQVMVGASQRLVRMVPAEPCAALCLRVSGVQMQGRFVTPSPGQCVATAYNRVSATVTVTDEFGNALRGVTVSGRFLDDYWTDKPVTGRTGRTGTVRFNYQGPACVGTVAFLVDNATVSGRVLDRTTGTLTGSVIPK